MCYGLHDGHAVTGSSLAEEVVHVHAYVRVRAGFRAGVRAGVRVGVRARVRVGDRARVVHAYADDPVGLGLYLLGLYLLWLYLLWLYLLCRRSSRAAQP